MKLKQCVLVVCILLISMGIYAITMEEWMRRGGPKKDPYNTKCKSFCDTTLENCRQKASNRAYRGADAWTADLKNCNDQYNRCIERCRNTK
jgi:hypothetical protein